MPYGRNRFTDPAAVLSTYDWAINHSEEEARDQKRNLERTTTTNGMGFVRQQGEVSPDILRFKGTILARDQLDKMQAFYDLCNTQTIFFRDFEGDDFEVLITSFNPIRVRTSLNPRDPTIPYHFWRYTIEMEVIREF